MGRVLALKLVWSSGTGFKTQPGVSSSSFGKSSLVTPISTLNCSNAMISADRSCAFQPSRAMLPSSAILGWPEMPRTCFFDRLAFMLARMSESRSNSTRPTPKVGVGWRKERLPWAAAVTKSGCAIPQLPASVRPVITKSWCTFPSGVARSDWNGKRAVKGGPLLVSKNGRTEIVTDRAGLQPFDLESGRQ